MNYEANTIQWKVGDLVLHDADHKSPEMLMRVIGYTKEGLCRTKYINEKYHKSSGVKDASTMKKVWKNQIASLHDPSRFGVSQEANLGYDLNDLSWCRDKIGNRPGVLLTTEELIGILETAKEFGLVEDAKGDGNEN